MVFKIHSTESRFVIGSSHILLGSVCVSTFHPRNVTVCGSEAVKKRSIVRQTVRSIYEGALGW